MVDRTLTPDGKTVILLEHDGSYSIRVDGAELMSTRQHASEEKIAELACAHLTGKRRTRVLIGGLGFGFTLKSALSSAPRDATVVVAELLAPVIAWNRNRSLPFAFDAMADHRVIVLQQDVGGVIRDSPNSFDSMILDVDNGPNALSTGGNVRLYDLTGLQLARAALRPSGWVAIWSVKPDQAFERLMIRAGFKVDVQRCRSRLNAGGWHTLFLGFNPVR